MKIVNTFFTAVTPASVCNQNLGTEGESICQYPWQESWHGAS